MMTCWKVLKRVAPIKPGCVDLLHNYYVTSGINLYVQQVGLNVKYIIQIYWLLRLYFFNPKNLTN
jgi:hypothetical protein